MARGLLASERKGRVYRSRIPTDADAAGSAGAVAARPRLSMDSLDLGEREGSCDDCDAFLDDGAPLAAVGSGSEPNRQRRPQLRPRTSSEEVSSAMSSTMSSDEPLDMVTMVATEPTPARNRARAAGGDDHDDHNERDGVDRSEDEDEEAEEEEGELDTTGMGADTERAEVGTFFDWLKGFRGSVWRRHDGKEFSKAALDSARVEWCDTPEKRRRPAIPRRAPRPAAPRRGPRGPGCPTLPASAPSRLAALPRSGAGSSRPARLSAAATGPGCCRRLVAALP